MNHVSYYKGVGMCSQVKEIHVDANPAADVTDQRNGE